MGKIMKGVIILFTLSLLLTVSMAGKTSRAKERVNKIIPEYMRKVDDWTKKLTQPNEFGVIFPADIYESSMKKLLGHAKGLLTYRIKKLQRKLKDKKVSSSCDKNWKKTEEMVEDNLRDVGRKYNANWGKFRVKAYPKRYIELQHKAAEGDKAAEGLLKPLADSMKHYKIPVPPPLPTTTTIEPTTTIGIRRPGGRVRPPARKPFIRLPTGQVVPAAPVRPGAAAAAAVGVPPAVVPVKPGAPHHPAAGPAAGPAARPHPAAAAAPFSNSNDLNSLIANVEHPAVGAGHPGPVSDKDEGGGSSSMIVGGIGVVVVLVVIAAVAAKLSGGKKKEDEEGLPPPLPMMGPPPTPLRHSPAKPSRHSSRRSSKQSSRRSSRRSLLDSEDSD